MPTRLPSRALPIVVATLSIATLASPARAQAPARDPAAAEALFDRGRAAAARNDWAQACPAFEQSMALDPATGTLLNLGECRYHIGKLAEAWQDFVEALRELPAEDPRRAYAKGRVDELDHRVAHLTVVLHAGAPGGTRVTKNGAEVPAATLGMALPITPGQVVLTAVAPGRAEGRFEMTLKEGESRRVEVEPGDAQGGETASSAAGSSPRPSLATTHAEVTTQGSSSSSLRTVGYVVGAAGVASVAVGTVTGILALSNANASRSACPSNACVDGAHLQTANNDANSARSLSTISTVTLLTGAAATGLGVYFILRGGSSSPERVGVTPTPGGAAVAWSGTF
jgi:hypothetical protein